ncbi:MAG: hypothetical protein K2X34_07510 [Hyphomonadaceae bacterium]|nr:hypothetical protein [Hyphomonadaceae bacterium]
MVLAMGEVWTVLVIPAALSAGFLVVQYFLAPRRAKLAVVPKNFAPLKMQLEAEFKEFEIKYQGQPIGDGFGWISGFIFNEGPRDIHESVISEPMRLILPAGFVWREVACTDHDCKPNIEWQGRVATLKWSMLRANERIHFAGLLEAQNSQSLSDFFDDLPKSLKISQRITDTQSVVTPFEARQYAIDWTDALFAILSLAMFAYISVAFIDVERRTFAATYFATADSSHGLSSDHPYLVSARNSETLCVLELAPGRPTNCVAELSPEEFSRLGPAVRPTVMSAREFFTSRATVILIGFFVALFLAVTWIFGSQVRRARYAEGGFIRLPSWLSRRASDAT